MNYLRALFFIVPPAVFAVCTLAWTFGAVAALLDPQVGDTDKKFGVLVAATGCWGALAALPWRRILASLPFIWKQK